MPFNKKSATVVNTNLDTSAWHTYETLRDNGKLESPSFAPMTGNLDADAWSLYEQQEQPGTLNDADGDWDAAL